MPTTVTASNTDCYRLAAQYLGDTTQFIRILQQNGNLTDPVIGATPVQIVIPDPDPTATGGVPVL